MPTGLIGLKNALNSRMKSWAVTWRAGVVFQSTSGFIYDVSLVVPFPVAKAGPNWVSYESYLFELRRNMHYYQTQQQANMGSFFFTTPAFVLSGFMFPIRNMPVAVQYFSYLNPLRYFMEIVRGIFLKGVGVAALKGVLLSRPAAATNTYPKDVRFGSEFARTARRWPDGRRLHMVFGPEHGAAAGQSTRG